MIYRQLGDSEVQTSAVAIGCWAMGGGAWGNQEDDNSIAAVHRAIDIGVTTLDTAPAYGKGHSEVVVGRALEGKRDKVVLATKWGLRWNDEGLVKDSTPARLEEEIAASLDRLKTDYIDLYQLHWPDNKTPIAETAKAVNKLYEQGTIRAIGVSNYSVDQMKEWMDNAPLHCLQPPFSMFRRGIAEDILPFCRDNHIATIVYSPLHMGLLTGKFDESSSFDDVREGQPGFQGERFKLNLKIVDRLQQIADRLKCSMTQLTVAWTIHQRGVTAAICGARRPDQIEDSAGGADIELTDGIIDEINAILQERDEELAKR